MATETITIDVPDGMEFSHMDGDRIIWRKARWRAEFRGWYWTINTIGEAIHKIECYDNLDDRRYANGWYWQTKEEATNRRDRALAGDEPEAETTTEWNRRFGQPKEAPSDEVILTAAEEDWVQRGRKISAIKSVRARTGCRLRQALDVVNKWEAECDRRKTPEATPPACPTNVPENGDWMPKAGDVYWVPGLEKMGTFPWKGCFSKGYLQSGNICRTRDIARAVQKRRKGGAE